MKKLFLFFPLMLLGEADILNTLKKKELNLDKNYTMEDSRSVGMSWINPVNLQYSYTRDNILSDTVTTAKTFVISVNQPIFKSGAIYYSVKYSKHLRNYNLKNIEIKRRELIKQAYDLVYDYCIGVLNREIIGLKIENAKIDIENKKEAFLSGVDNSTDLNNAMLNLNSLRLSMIDSQSSIDNIEYSFKNISDLNIDEIKPPTFAIISRDKYIKNNLDFIQSRQQQLIKHDLYKMQVGNQLLSLNLNASYTNQKKSYSNTLPDSKSEYYKIGFSITLPLNVTSVNKIQKTKIDYLKSRLLLQDKKVQLNNQYESVLNQIKAIDDKIEIYHDDINIYEQLIRNTLESIKSGNATVTDLEVLQNTKKTLYMNVEILKLKKQKLLLSLYYKLVNWKAEK